MPTMMYGLLTISLATSAISSWISNTMYVSRCAKAYTKVYTPIIRLNCIGSGLGSHLASGLRVSVSKRK
ncbi:MAG: hypothetical protein Altm2KO_31590 [Alteromonas macleodii]